MDVLPTDRCAAVLAATAGSVAENAERITAAFYRRLFAAHPALRPLFNDGNQATGRQARALAAALVAFAGHLLGEPGPPVDPILRRIAHRHAS
ncbi:globin domain-containing protein, partial [Frankia sp. AgB32]|nr:globin domain-containing protein [Frankia sp. AgB32]